MYCGWQKVVSWDETMYENQARSLIILPYHSILQCLLLHTCILLIIFSALLHIPVYIG